MSVDKVARRFAFAGGGSGGHLTPSLAIAERLTERSSKASVMFLCSSRAVDAEVLTRHGARFHALPSVPAPRSPRQVVPFLRGQWQAITEATAHLRDFAPEALVSVGGFASAAGLLAARRLGIRTILFNLDARPGRANRVLSRLADSVVSAVPVVTGRLRLAEVVGPPIRREAVASLDAAGCRQAIGLRPELPVLLVTGASQGSTSINRLMPRWLRRDAGLLADWQVLHLTGGGEEELLRQAYADAGVEAKVVAFQHPMALAWGAASLAISRAGASSVAEIHANAVPSVLVPYPHHRDRHQWLNAAPLVEMGGAVVAEDRIDPDANLATIADAAAWLLQDASRRRRMSEVLRARPPADGAAAVAARLLEKVGAT